VLLDSLALFHGVSVDTEHLIFILVSIYLYWGLNVKNVRELTTEEVREAWRNTLVPTGKSTYEFVDPDDADTEFNLWLVTERKRVAELAIKKERKRIIKILEDWIGKDHATKLINGENSG
jgi:hypothetical protein